MVTFSFTTWCTHTHDLSRARQLSPVVNSVGFIYNGNDLFTRNGIMAPHTVRLRTVSVILYLQEIQFQHRNFGYAIITISINRHNDVPFGLEFATSYLM